jgi:hypothetical protein
MQEFCFTFNRRSHRSIFSLAVFIISALYFAVPCLILSNAAANAAGSSSSAGSSTLTEADFAYGRAATGSGSIDSGPNGQGYNTTMYSTQPNNAFDNMNIQQSNEYNGRAISDNWSTGDTDSVNSNSTASGLTDSATTNQKLRAQLPYVQAANTANNPVNYTLANPQYQFYSPITNGEIGKSQYNFGFKANFAQTGYQAAQGASDVQNGILPPPPLPEVGTGSIIMKTGFTPY